MTEIQRGDNKPVSRQRFIEPLGAGQVPAGPGAAMEVDDRRERSLALRLVEPRNQPRVAVAEIFDIFGREFVSVIRHVHSLPGLLCCSGDSEIEADFTPYSLCAERERRQAR